MNRATKIKLRQVGVIAICWMATGLLITLYDHFGLLTENSLGPSATYSFIVSATRNVGAGLIGALLGGSMLVFYVNPHYQDRSYAFTIFIVSISFLLIVAIITVLLGLVLVPLHTGKPLTDPVSRDAFINFLKDSYHYKAAMGWAVVVAITQLLLQVSSKFGQADFWNIIRGKYTQPKEEKRIFMFLDLNSSTTIAEQLGDEAYHALLKDFFADITTPILENKGSIYQYVGDEVVIAWNYKDGKENMHCIKCFFDMKLRIHQLRDKYFARYGLVPTFKAGVHGGRVIAGEVGIIKRDITYSGDVLNTTSRILNKCTELRQELIVSAELMADLYMTSFTQYVLRPLGVMKLKGKEREVGLSALLAA